MAGLGNARREPVGQPAVRAVILNYHDVTDRKQAEARGEFLATIVNSSEDAILGATLEGIIASWNASAERLYGYTAAQMIGQRIDRLYRLSSRTNYPISSHGCVAVSGSLTTKRSASPRTVGVSTCR